MRNFIKKEIEKVVGKVDFDVFRPASPQGGSEKFGDYSSNVAMILAKDLKKNPVEIANSLKSQVLSLKTNLFEKIEVAGPGFLNFWLKDEVFIKNIEEILKEKEKYGSNDFLKEQKIMVEYTDPNPFKEFHIGHLMSNAIGESIARMYEKQGADVKRACYQGDVGIHVAKAIYGLTHNPWETTGLYFKNGFPDVESLKKYADVLVNEGPKNIELSYKALGILGQAYSYGAGKYEESEIAKKEIIEINKKIYERSDKKINAFYDLGKQWSLDYFEVIYKGLGTKFDYYFFESETGKFGKEIVEKNTPSVFEESDGAIIFSKEKSGLHTRVFINSEGIPTYEAKELGLAKIKYDKFKYDTSVVITGNEINDYFGVLLRAMEFVYPELAKKTKHIGHGMLRLPTGKMSSRTGDVIKAVNLLSDVEKLIMKKIADRELSQEDKKEIAAKVATAAVKYSILKQSSGKDVIYDLDKSISFEGDSGPYLQYTYVRAMSVLKMAEEKGIKASLDAKNIKIIDVEKELYRFPEIVEEAGEICAPNYICSYLIELAHCFNSYYSKFKIVSEEPESPYRVSLTKAVAITIKNGLNILAIPAPEKM